MKYYEQTVAEIREDFERRKRIRREKELGWQLNMNFLNGNQYCSVTPENVLTSFDKTFFWQHREVFNHIAPVMETRSSKLLRTRPSVKILPISQKSGSSALKAEKLVNAVFEKNDMRRIISEATAWSEVTGTAFYKVVWNAEDSGNAEISVCPPFEIYPDSLQRNDVEECRSIIHARVLPVAEIKRIWNEEVKPEKLQAFSLSSAVKKSEENLEDSATVIEKYEKPTGEYPFGRLIIVAGDKLLYLGPLPYKKGKKFFFPFVRQVSLPMAGSFFGTSVIERLIPLQRAYNDVKNKKHELLSRLAGGILAVEDGSVNVDELEEEGLYPGKILVYRQGSTVPSFMTTDKLPSDFISEEERILKEFSVISGVSDFMRNSSPVRVTSGTALNLLLEQDDSRISVSSDSINGATREIAGKIISLYAQFAPKDKENAPNATENDAHAGYNEASANGNEDCEEDFSIITESEGNSAPVRMISIALEIFNSGLLNGEDGKVSLATKNKLLETMGLGSLIQNTEV